MAVPIMRDDGIVAAIGVIGPETRCGLAWRARVARALPDAGRDRSWGRSGRPAGRDTSGLSYAGSRTSRDLTMRFRTGDAARRWTCWPTSLPCRTGTRASRSLTRSTGLTRPAAWASASGTSSRSARSAGPTPTRLGWPTSTSRPTWRRRARPGFVHYYKGPAGADGACLSFCLWESRGRRPRRRRRDRSTSRPSVCCTRCTRPTRSSSCA